MKIVYRPMALILVAALMGCESPNISTKAVERDLQAIPLLPASKNRRITVVADKVPIIHNRPERPERKLELYLTPSCSYCISIYNGIFNTNVIGSVNFEDVSVTVALVPLRDADFDIIKNIMCVSPENIPFSVDAYYKGVLKISKEKHIIPVDDLDELSQGVAMRYGATPETLKACRQDTIVEYNIIDNYNAAANLGGGKTWPFVVINGRGTTYTLPAEIVRAMSIAEG